MSNPDFTTTSQAQCVAWYVETVGTPSWTTLTLDQLRLIRKAQMSMAVGHSLPSSNSTRSSKVALYISALSPVSFPIATVPLTSSFASHPSLQNT